MRRILVIGATGLLGRAVVGEARRRGARIAAVARRAATLPDGTRVEAADVTVEGVAKRLVAAAQPTVVLNLAALTNVDACEEREAEARRLHADAAGALAAAAAERGARFVQVSTDSVFSGPGVPFSEDSPPRPLNAYARTKLEGETRVVAAHSDALVVRTNFFGARDVTGGRSLAEWALGELAAGRPIDGFEDVLFNPLWTGHLAPFLLDLADQREGGLVHLGASDSTSKHAFLRALARQAGFEPARVRPARQADLAGRAPRPLCTVLDVRRAEARLGMRMPTVAEGIRAFCSWRTNWLAVGAP